MLQIIKIIKLKLSCASFTIVLKFYFLLLHKKRLLKFLHAKHVFLVPCKWRSDSDSYFIYVLCTAPSSMSSIIFIKVDLPHGNVLINAGYKLSIWLCTDSSKSAHVPWLGNCLSPPVEGLLLHPQQHHRFWHPTLNFCRQTKRNQKGSQALT